MSQLLRLFHDAQGDWVYVSTGEWSGACIVIAPRNNSILPTPESEFEEVSGVIDLDSGAGWHPVVSLNGAFEIIAPREDPLNGWTLQFYGFSRLFFNLKLDVVAELFGPEVAERLKLLGGAVSQLAEDIADYWARQLQIEPATTREIQAQMAASFREAVEIPDPTPEVTEARRELLSITHHADDTYTLPRGYLLDER
jgi:hypothetical protein